MRRGDEEVEDLMTSRANGKSDSATGSPQQVKIQDRIRELRRVTARDLLPNPKNWRRHPKAQSDALRALLAEIGYADALLARELPDGRLMLVDGHLRAETTPDAWLTHVGLCANPYH